MVGEFVAYDKLPQQFKNSVDAYYKYEMGFNIKDNQLFGIANVKTIDLINLIRTIDDYRDFERYHAEYLSVGDVVMHRKVWAVILDTSGGEIIYDG